MELFILYLWLKIDTIIGFFIFAGCSSVIALIFSAIRFSDYSDTLDKKKYWNTKIKVFLVLIPLLFSTGNLIPSKQDTAILVGAHYALKVAESPEAAKVMTLLRQKADTMLDEAISKETTNARK